METLEIVALFVDVVVFFQNDVSMVVLPHHSEDILFYDLGSSLFRSNLQVGEKIILSTLQTIQASLVTTMYVRANVEMTH